MLASGGATVDSSRAGRGPSSGRCWSCPAAYRKPCCGLARSVPLRPQHVWGPGRIHEWCSDLESSSCFAEREPGLFSHQRSREYPLGGISARVSWREPRVLLPSRQPRILGRRRTLQVSGQARDARCLDRMRAKTWPESNETEQLSAAAGTVAGRRTVRAPEPAPSYRGQKAACAASARAIDCLRIWRQRGAGEGGLRQWKKGSRAVDSATPTSG